MENITPSSLNNGLEVSGELYKKILPLVYVTTTLIGFIAFSYAVQEDSCFTYDDWRRVFTLIGFSALAILSVFGLISLSITTTFNSDDKYKLLIRIIMILVGTFFLSMMYGPTINLMNKSRLEFETVDIGETVKHPKQKTWTIVISALLIYGSLIPLGTILADTITGKTMIDELMKNEI